MGLFDKVMGGSSGTKGQAMYMATDAGQNDVDAGKVEGKALAIMNVLCNSNNYMTDRQIAKEAHIDLITTREYLNHILKKQQYVRQMN